MKTPTLKQSALAVVSLVSINLALLPLYDRAISDIIMPLGHARSPMDFLLNQLLLVILPTFIAIAFATWALLKISGKTSSMFLNMVGAPQMEKNIQLMLSLGTMVMYFVIVFPMSLTLIAIPGVFILLPFQLYVGRKNAQQNIKSLSLL